MKPRDRKAALAAQTQTIDKKIAELESKHGKTATTTDSGLKYIVLKEGTGGSPQRGQSIKAHYTGTFLDGRKFDSSYDRNQPIEFPVGTRRVIPGWDEALISMKKGEKRILVIPSDLAYGPQGRGPIPPNTPLMFEVELVDF